jgi:DNA-binding NarL/FixJ family response regulator
MFNQLQCDDKTISEIEDGVNYIPLTLLEKRILRDIVCGYSNSRIAKELSINVRALKKYIDGIMKKLEIRNFGVKRNGT